MGAKTWMLAYCKGVPSEVLKTEPPLDRKATLAFAKQLFPTQDLIELDDTDLYSTCPPDDEIVVGCFPGLSIIAATEFGIDAPSKLPPAFVDAMPSHSVYFLAMHSVVDWFAYAIWRGKTLQRSLSLSPDSGVIEDIGSKESFEEPFWAGKVPAFDPGDEDDEYPFNFHPLELGEAALLALFGYQIEGAGPPEVSPEKITLMRFKRKKRSWWRWFS